MKHGLLTLGTVAFSVALAIPATAATHKMKPGLWAFSVDMKMARHPRLQAESAFKRCVKAEDSGKGRFVPELETHPGMNCSVKDFARNGNTATYTRVCSGPRGSVTSRGKLTFVSPTRFDAEIHTNGLVRGRQVDTIRTVHAKWVGNCGD